MALDSLRITYYVIHERRTRCPLKLSRSFGISVSVADINGIHGRHLPWFVLSVNGGIGNDPPLSDHHRSTFRRGSFGHRPTMSSLCPVLLSDLWWRNMLRLRILVRWVRAWVSVRVLRVLKRIYYAINSESDVTGSGGSLNYEVST